MYNIICDMNNVTAARVPNNIYTFNGLMGDDVTTSIRILVGEKKELYKQNNIIIRRVVYNVITLEQDQLTVHPTAAVCLYI